MSGADGGQGDGGDGGAVEAVPGEEVVGEGVGIVPAEFLGGEVADCLP